MNGGAGLRENQALVLVGKELHTQSVPHAVGPVNWRYISHVVSFTSRGD